MKYKILANTKSYHEHEVLEGGKIGDWVHDFEGFDIISYKIVNEDDTSEVIIDDIEHYKNALKGMGKLNK